MVYIVHGQDEYLVKKNIENLIKKTHKNVNYDYSTYSLQEDTILNIINEIQTTSLFEENKIIIINDENKLWEKYIKDERFLYLLSNHSEKIMIIIKILKNDFKLSKNFEKFNILKIKNYTKPQFIMLVNKVCNSFKICITKEAIDFLVENLPDNVNIFLNELSKLRSFNQLVTLELVRNIVPRYFEVNVFKTIEYLLKKDYKNFWTQFYYYNSINYDKIKLINILAYQLELIRDIKLLINQNNNYEQISKELNISHFQVKILAQYSSINLNINNILLKLCELDYNIKKGKCDKDIAIDLFFLNI